MKTNLLYPLLMKVFGEEWQAYPVTNAKILASGALSSEQPRCFQYLVFLSSLRVDVPTGRSEPHEAMRKPVLLAVGSGMTRIADAFRPFEALPISPP
jgi:hypothetical protein